MYFTYLLIILVFQTVHASGNVLSHEMHLKESNLTDISRVIQTRTNMETAVVKTFNKFFNNFTTSPQFYTKSVIYVCDKKCSRENAHEYGLTSAFLLSVLSERKFSILSTQVFDFYEKWNYNWKLNASEILNKPGGMILAPSANQNRDVTDLHLLEGELQKMNFDQTFKNDFVTLSGNHNWIQDLRRHRRTYEKMPWLFKMHACDVNRLVHMGLFKVPQYVKEKIHTKLIDKVAHNRLICFNGKVNTRIGVKAILDFIVAKYQHSGYKIYTSNTSVKEYFNSMYDVGINETVIQFELDELFKQGKHVKQTSENFRKLQDLANIYTLTICDVLITTESATGILAAHLRPNSDGLFCYRNGTIFPCTRELIAGSFRDQENAPVHLDERYYRLKRKN